MSIEILMNGCRACREIECKCYCRDKMSPLPLTHEPYRRDVVSSSSVFVALGHAAVDAHPLTHSLLFSHHHHPHHLSTLSTIRDFEYWEEKDYFVEGFNKYYDKNPDEPQMLPETYILDTEANRIKFHKRLTHGGYNEPWVLKIPNKNNGSGITMLGPNSKELKGVFDTVEEHLEAEKHKHTQHRMIVQSYICNELTWFQHQKFDLRFYWMVCKV